MNSTLASAPAPRAASTRPAEEPRAQRWFYTVATLLLLGLTLIGFHHFYFRGMAYPGRPLTPPIKTLVIAHSLAMSLWMLLALVQPFLVASGKRALHLALGRVGAVLAVVLVALGVKLGIAACKVAPPGMMFGPLDVRQFMAIPVCTGLLFGLFVAAGVLWRKRPAAHRPMMFLASLAAVSAAIARIDPLNRLYQGGVFDRIFGVFFFSVLIGALFLAARCLVAKRFDRWFAGGWAAFALWAVLVTQIAPTPLWDSVAGVLLR
jgi:hypothetical protein